MILNNEEMYQVEGGSISPYYIKLGILGGIIMFAVGVLDGVLHPKKCEN